MNDISLYLDRITWWNARPNFLATVSATLQPFVDAQNFIEALPQAFDLDVAIGVQLDVVGQWINLSRKITLPIPDPWFRFGDARRGWGRGIWYNPNYSSGTYINALDDDTYRRLLRARILANHWDGTSARSVTILQTYFIDSATYVIGDDKQYMQTIVGMSGKIPDTVSLEIFGGDYLLLTTAGVRTTRLVTSVNYSPLFGFGVSNEKISGFGSGAWGVSPQYLILNPPYETINFQMQGETCVYRATGGATLNKHLHHAVLVGKAGDFNTYGALATLTKHPEA